MFDDIEEGMGQEVIPYIRVRQFLNAAPSLSGLGYGSPMHKRLHEIVDKAEKYDEIQRITQEDSLASDGLEMIQSAMRMKNIDW